MLQIVSQTHQGIVVDCARGDYFAVDKHHLAVTERASRKALGTIFEHPAHRGRLTTRNRTKVQTRRLHGMNTLNGVVADTVMSSRNQRIVHIGQHKFNHKAPIRIGPTYCNDQPK